jgi:glycine cleavage system H protein
MATPDNLRYTKDNTWVLVNGNEATFGITDFAQKRLGDIVFVESPQIGDTIDTNNAIGTVESVKTVIEIFSALSGEVIEVNESIMESPELLNEDPYGEGWLIKLKITNPNEVKELLTAAEYDNFCKEEA